MSWEDFEWPDLSPRFPTPLASRRPPERPVVPAGIGVDIANAERRRKRLVLLCLWTGLLIFVAGILLQPPAGGGHRSTPLGLGLLTLGLLLLFPVAALLAFISGPFWGQRQDHWRLLHWQSAYLSWLTGERDRYLASLAPEDRETLRQILESRNPESRENVWNRVERVEHHPETVRGQL
jgi:hypothetical protein